MGKRRGPHESEKEGSGTHVAETAPPLLFFPPAVLCNSSLNISLKNRRRSINKHKRRRGEKEGHAVVEQVEKESESHLDVCPCEITRETGKQAQEDSERRRGACACSFPGSHVSASPQLLRSH